ncbi:retrovirus-related pol polyprotein from transposon TNT 1-94 [Tanacetum coccineum]
MTTLANKAILSGADNRPPMLEKDMYDSWKSIMELYMMNRQHGRMILESVENGPLIWPSIEENGVTRPKKYSELSATEAIQADCDIKATNIILQGLPPEVYALVSNHKVAKELWARIQLLMQGTSLTKQERECKLYDEFDKFAYKKGETLREFYLRFSLLLNDMNIYNMKLEQFQVNTKFLNTLPPEWSKFVTDVKLVRDLHTTNVDQLHAYLVQHEFHANEVLQGITLPSKWKQSGKQMTVICYNCKGEGHMSKQCTKPKKKGKKRNDSWFKDKVLLVQAQVSDQILHEEELVILADPGIPEIALMANLSHYGSDALAEAAVQNSNSSAQQDALILSMTEQVKTQVVNFPKELPKVSMVNTSLKKLKHHLAGFDVVVKERTTPTTITEGSWGFEHTKACFRDEIIPFVKALKDLFNTFDQYLIDELSEVQNVFHQMEQAVEQHRLESKTFEVKMNQVLNENERLLEQVISKDIVNTIVNSSVDIASVNVHECEKCLKHETGLLNKKDFIEKEFYDKLFKSFTTLEKQCHP